MRERSSGPLEDSREEQELIRQAQQQPWDRGGAEVFWALWARHEPWLRIRIRTLRHNPGQGSREIFQEAVLDRVRENLIRGLPQYTGRGALRAFLIRIVQRAAIDEFRHQKRRATVPIVDAREEHGSNEPALDPFYRSPSLLPLPDASALAKDRRAKLRLVLAELAGESDKGLKCALALRMRFLEDRPLAYIASEMGVVEHTIWYWIKDGLSRVAEILRDQYGVEGLSDL